MKKGWVFLFAQFFLLLPTFVVHAAILYMDPNEAELKRGDTMVVSVRIDTEDGECVNVVDGVITYSENIQPVDTSRGNSIFSLWVEEPKIDKANHTITFAAGLPNGYCGRIPGDPQLTNNVIDLLFQSPGLQIGSSASGNDARIDFNPQTHVLLNDGFGTDAPLSTFGSHIALSREPGSSVLNEWQNTVQGDEVPPEKFSIALEHTLNAFSGKYFVTFNTTDKQSGIDHYEIIEEPLASKNLFGWGAVTAPWKTAQSPYVLDDQSLNSTIRVKAIDKAGNEYIATYVPDASTRTLSYDNLIIIGGLAAAGALLLIGLSLAVFFILRARRRKKEAQEAADETYEP
jgi:hypothetical protein